MVRIYRNAVSTMFVIEGYGDWNLNYVTISNPSGNDIMIQTGQLEVNTWLFSDILNEAGAQAGIDLAATLAYLNAANTDVLPGTQDDVTAQIDANLTVVANTAAAGAAQVTADSKILSIVPGTGIAVDNTDPINPIVSATGAMTFGSEWQFEQNAVASIITAPPVPADNILTAVFPGPSYLTLTTPVIPAGDYLLEWYYVWAYNSQARDFVARINQDSAAALFGFHRQEPKDSAGGANPDAIPGAGTDQRHPASGRQVVTLTNAVHTFELEFASGSAGVIAAIGNATMTFFRVA